MIQAYSDSRSSQLSQLSRHTFDVSRTSHQELLGRVAFSGVAFGYSDREVFGDMLLAFSWLSLLSHTEYEILHSISLQPLSSGAAGGDAAVETGGSCRRLTYGATVLTSFGEARFDTWFGATKKSSFHARLILAKRAEHWGGHGVATERWATFLLSFASHSISPKLKSQLQPLHNPDSILDDPH